MRKNFDAVMRAILRSEGGFVDHPKDPGGATNHGITRAALADWRGRVVSRQEVADLSRAEAVEIYRARYWTPLRGDVLPAGVDLVVMDAAVNSGGSRAVKWLQACLKVKADGELGPGTLRALRAADPAGLVQAYQARRLGFLRHLPSWAVFGRGWASRVERTGGLARVMVAAGRLPTAPPLPHLVACAA